MPGIIAAVCTSQKSGIPKYMQVVCVVGEYGLEKDVHNRPERWSYGRKIWVPNIDRHILIVAEEVKRLIARNKKIEGGKGKFLQPGSLSENILCRGLGDLSQLVGGQMLAIGGGKVLLRVIEAAKPCKHVRAAYGIEVYVALQERRGVYCSVHEGIGQKISPNDSIEIVGGGEPVTSEPPPKNRPTTDATKIEYEVT